VAIWGPGIARSTLMLWVLWFAITFSYYGFFTWIPTLLVKLGFTVTKSFTYSIIIYLAQIPGYYSAAFMSEKPDRTWTIVVYMVLGGVAALLLSGARSAGLITLYSTQFARDEIRVAVEEIWWMTRCATRRRAARSA
jgi:putative MFS transporter